MDRMSIHPLLTGPRLESYEVELLDRYDQSQGFLDRVLGGGVEQNYDAVIRGGCSLDLHNVEGVNWHQSRVRPWVTVNGLRWPLGVFLPTSPDIVYSATHKSWKFKGVDKLSVLDGDAIPSSLSLPAGTVVTTAVKDIIEATGETSLVLTASPKMLSEQLVWGPGTTRLRIVNDLLSSITYAFVWADGFGRYRVEPYIDPRNRSVRAVFEKGEVAIHKADLTRTQDIASVPNRVIMTTSGSDDTPALLAVAENHEPGSPYSYESRGNRWVTKTYEGAEAVDQQSLDRQASRNLWNSSTPPAYYSVEHAVVPIDPDDTVRFIHDDIDVLVQVNEFGIDLTPGSTMGGKWKELS